MKHSKGKWRLSNYHYPHNEIVVTINPSTDNDSRAGIEGRRICRVDGIAEHKANAELIAEAGTVTNETGYTPRQLAEQKADLLEACKKAVEYLDYPPENMADALRVGIDTRHIVQAAIAAATA